MILCAFGCGCEAKFIQKNGKEICQSKASKCLALRAKNKSNTGRKFSAEHIEKISKANKETKANQVIKAWNKNITKEMHPGMMAVSDAQKKLAIEQITKIIPSDDPIYNDIKKYRNRIIARTKHNYKIYKDLINPNNYVVGTHGDDIYHVDHIYPIVEGFRNNVPIEIMASVANLQLLLYSDNVRKSNKVDVIPTVIKQFLKEQIA
jgi:hypothetical protein